MRHYLPNGIQTGILCLQTSTLRLGILGLLKWVSGALSIPSLILAGMPVYVSQHEARALDQLEITGLLVALLPPVIFVVSYIWERRWQKSIMRRFQSNAILSGGPGELLRKSIVPGPHGRIDIYGATFAWTSPDINHWLVQSSLNQNSLPVELGSGFLAYSEQHTSERIRKLKEYAIAAKLQAGARIFNDNKIRLASNFEIAPIEKVTIEKTDYVSSLMTDQMAFQRILDQNTGEVLSDGQSSFLDVARNRRTLKPLGMTQTSNQIGVSTIAFTTDGAIPLVVQTHRNAQSGGTLAPSGSGSLDWDDATKVLAANDLWEIVKFGAARELLEETGISDKLDAHEFAKNNIRIYGFARMIHRAGKPEFFCVATIPFTLREINQMGVSRAERHFTNRTQTNDGRPLDKTIDPAKEISRVCKFYSDKSNIEIIINSPIQLSYPLSHGLDLLSEAVMFDGVGDQLATFVAANLKG